MDKTARTYSKEFKEEPLTLLRTSGKTLRALEQALALSHRVLKRQRYPLWLLCRALSVSVCEAPHLGTNGDATLLTIDGTIRIHSIPTTKYLDNAAGSARGRKALR